MSYCSLPWLAYYAFRIGDRLADGLALGFWMAFAVMNGSSIRTSTPGCWRRRSGCAPCGSSRPAVRARLLVHTVAAVGLFLALCGVRLATVLLVMRDDRRGWATIGMSRPSR